MRSGTLNIPVEIYRLVKTGTTAMGQPITTETLYCSPWANVTSRRGRELVNDGQIVAEQYTRFEFNYYDVEDLREDMIIVCEGVRYDIKALLPDTNLKEYYQVDAVTQMVRTGG